MAEIETRSITTSTLLRALLESRDEAAWREVDERYRPIVLRLGQRCGLGADDAADVAQEALTQFFEDYRAGKYDRQRGRLRAWLTGIARHRIADMLRKRAARRERHGDSVVALVPDEAELSRMWDGEAQAVLLERALCEMRRSTRLKPQTCEAFRLQLIEHWTPEAIAARLQMTVRSVYLAKHRCLNHLREILAALQAAYELE